MKGPLVLAKKFDGPRAVRPAEIPGLLHLLNRSFGAIPVPIEREQPHIYGRIREFMGRHRVIVHRGEVVAHVGVFPLRYVTPSGSAMAGGIGGVCTDGRFRGRGFMAGLLGHSVDLMREASVPLSILWGSRYRYARFGWEPAGRRMSVGMGKASVHALRKFRFRVVRLSRPARFADEMHSLHRAMPFRVDRDPATFRLMLERAGRRVYGAFQGGRLAAYAVANCLGWPRRKRGGHMWWDLEETAGGTPGILGILRWLLSRPGKWRMQMDWPLVGRPVPAPLVEAMDSWSSSIGWLGQVRVNDAPALLKGLGQGALVPAVRRLRLGNRAQARLLLGPLSPAENGLLSAAAAPARRLPLGVFMYRSDNV